MHERVILNFLDALHSAVALELFLQRVFSYLLRQVARVQHLHLTHHIVILLQSGLVEMDTIAV